VTFDPAFTAVPLIVMGVAREDALAAVSVLPNLPARALVIVVAKFGSLPKAAASSWSVSRAAGEELTSAAIAARTNAVVAICVVLVPAGAVGAVGVPVKAGEASGAAPRVDRAAAASASSSRVL